MNARTASVLLVSVLAAGALARDPQPPAETIREVAAYVRKHMALERQAQAATAAARAKSDRAQWWLEALQGECPADGVARLRERHRANKERADAARAELACARIVGAEERAAKLKEVELEVAAAQAAVNAAAKGFSKEQDRVREESVPVNEALRELMGKVGRRAEELGFVRTVCRATVSDGRAGVEWQDKDGRTLAHLSLRLSRPMQTEAKERLWKRFPLLRQSDAGASFLVGSMFATFSPVGSHWQDKSKHAGLAARIIDFEALERFREAVEDEGELRRKLVEAMRRSQDLKAHSRQATASAVAWHGAAQRKAQELGRPHDPKRMAGMESQCGSCEIQLERAGMGLAAAAITDLEERRKATEKAAKAVKEAEAELVEASLPFSSAERALGKDARRADFHLWEMVEGVVQTPTQLAVVDADVCPDLGRPSAMVVYRGERAKVASAHLRFLPVPERMAEQTKIDGKYPVQFWGSESITFWVGGVSVKLNAAKAEWQDKDRILKLAIELLDLDAIAAWPGIADIK